MKKLLLAAAASLLLCGAAQAQSLFGGPNASAQINISTATTTKIISGSSSRGIDVTQINFMAAGADTVTLEYGSGSSCGTGTTVLAGPYTMATNNVVSLGDGFGSLFVVPVGKDVCVLTTGAVVLGGSVSWNNQVGSL